MNPAAFHLKLKTTGEEKVLFLILLTCIGAVLAGPLFCEGSLALAQFDATRTSPFRLVGTIEGGPFTGAVIDDTKNPQAFYRLNDRLPDESQIVRVDHNHIVLKWPDGTKMELYTTPGAIKGSASAAPAAAPYAASRQAGQPMAERSVDPTVRTAQGRPTHSAGSNDGGAAGRRPSRMDRQNPNQQNDQVQDPNKRKGAGRGIRNRPRAAVEN
jgi:hypothetical protein